MNIVEAMKSGVLRKVVCSVKTTTRLNNVYLGTEIPEEYIPQILNDLRKELSCGIKDNPIPKSVTDIIDGIEYQRV
ncbi:MAG: hypothetical protein Athens071416_12 [Parcubacteria group bacterium Athens0714_16]|nr:MAG: hypothetical protein Athens071416_12 [Parcubacteria group bacterium Athens0714_16]